MITGISINNDLSIEKAAADKLKRELEEFGFPPVFPVDTTEESKWNK